MPFVFYELLRQFSERNKLKDPAWTAPQFTKEDQPTIPAVAVPRDEAFYVELRACAEPLVEASESVACRIVGKTRTFYPGIVEISRTWGNCPVDKPAPASPSVVLIEVIGGESLNPGQYQSLIDFLEEEYARVKKSYDLWLGVCLGKTPEPPSPGYPPAPMPPEGNGEPEVKPGPDIATEEATSFLALVAVGAGLYLILKKS